MAEIRFDFAGFSEYERALVRMLAALSDLRLFWPRLVPVWVGWMRQRFETEGEFGGEPWAPLSATYLAIKQRLYPGKGILYASGQLRQETSRPQRVVTPRTLTFIIPDFGRDDGTQMDPDWFQKGNDNTPPRPIIPEQWNVALPSVMQAEVDALAEEWVQEMSVKLGLV